MGVYQNPGAGLGFLRPMGIRMIAYIDDILILAESQEITLHHTNALGTVPRLCDELRKVFATCTPDKDERVLGITLYSAQSELRLPIRKIKAIHPGARQIARHQATPAHKLARLLRKMRATASVLPPSPVFYRHLQIYLERTLRTSDRNYDSRTVI